MKTKDIKKAKKEVEFYISELKETAADRLGIEKKEFECYIAELKERAAKRLLVEKKDAFTIIALSIIEAYIDFLEFRFIGERAGEDMMEVCAAAALAADELLAYVRSYANSNSLIAMVIETLAKRANELDNFVMEEYYEFSGVKF